MKDTKKARSEERKTILRGRLRYFDTYADKACYCSGVIAVISRRYDLTPAQIVGMIREVVEVLEGEEV